jgi:hypothetical protein
MKMRCFASELQESCAGEVQIYRKMNTEFMKVKGASHMVPIEGELLRSRKPLLSALSTRV